MRHIQAYITPLRNLHIYNAMVFVTNAIIHIRGYVRFVIKWL